MFKYSNYLWKISYYLAYFLPSYLGITFYLGCVDIFKHGKVEASFCFSLALTILAIVALFILDIELTSTRKYTCLLGIQTVKVVAKDKANWFNAKHLTVINLLIPVLGVYTFINYPIWTMIVILLVQSLLYTYQYRHFGFCYPNYGLLFMSYEIIPVFPIGDSKVQYVFRVQHTSYPLLFGNVDELITVIPLAKDSQIGIN